MTSPGKVILRRILQVVASLLTIIGSISLMEHLEAWRAFLDNASGYWDWAITAFGIGLWVVSTWWDRLSAWFLGRPSKARTSEKAFELADDIFLFLQETDTSTNLLEEVIADRSVSEDERRRQWQNRTEAEMRRSGAHVAEFQRRFGSRIAQVQESLLSLGVVDDRDTRTWEHPVNRLVMAQIAHDLSAAGRRLEPR